MRIYYIKQYNMNLKFKGNNIHVSKIKFVKNDISHFEIGELSHHQRYTFVTLTRHTIMEHTGNNKNERKRKMNGINDAKYRYETII